jgi:hypothetical protein
VSQSTPIARDVQSLPDHLLGKKVEFIQICGINSLKTLQPAPDALIGDQVTDVVVNEEARQLHLVCDKHTIVVDLARTGTVHNLERATRWSIAGGSPMPTARILFDDETAVDFREPAKTKRITIAIHPSVAQ